MPFNSPVFCFLFAPSVILLHLVAPARWRLGLVIGASILFYGWGEPRFVGAVLLSSLIDHALVLATVRAGSRRTRRLLLAVGVAANLGMLLWCKYAGFVFDNLAALLGPLGLPRPDILIPLGISFIVFEKITYLVDVYRGTSAPARSASHYLAFVFLFPKLLAGPILKFHEMRAQIERHVVTIDDIEAGLARFMLGLVKKVLIADGVAEVADRVFSAPPGSLGAADAWLGAVAFAVQIYFDFSGYSDMAIGLARALGFRLRENFDQPYLAVGFTDFWRRWHISLSTWIRDYLYVPLGGNRRGPARTSLNLWVCFLASGLWHGPAWTFVLWGAFHGLFVSADHLGFARALRRLPAPVAVAATFLLVVLGWVLFRAPSLAAAGALYRAMGDVARPAWVAPSLPADTLVCLAVGLALSFMPLAAARRLGAAALAGWERPVALLGLFAGTVWSLGRMLAVSFQPFIYFRF